MKTDNKNIVENKQANNEEYTDFEYMDHDIHIKGRIRKEAKRVTDLVILISSVITAIGIIILCCSDPGSTENIAGIILAVAGGIGILFLAPVAGSFFE